MLHSDCNKAQKELNPDLISKCLEKRLILWDISMSNIEINVLLNQRPVCLFHQTKCGCNVYGSRQYSLKEV